MKLKWLIVKERTIKWVAWRVPRAIVYWCVVRVWAYGISNGDGYMSPEKLTYPEALRRWDDR